jgi:hypothetical protein
VALPASEALCDALGEGVPLSETDAVAEANPDCVVVADEDCDADAAGEPEGLPLLLGEPDGEPVGLPLPHADELGEGEAVPLPQPVTDAEADAEGEALPEPPTERDPEGLPLPLGEPDGEPVAPAPLDPAEVEGGVCARGRGDRAVSGSGQLLQGRPASGHRPPRYAGGPSAPPPGLTKAASA